MGMSRKLGTGEIHFVDMPSTQLDCDTTGTVALINGCVPGTGENQRFGRRMIMKSVEIRLGQFTVASSSASQTEQLRVLLVYDRQSNGAAPAWADVIQSMDAASTATSLAWSFPNVSNKQRFAILRDWLWKPNPIANTSVNQVAQDAPQASMNRDIHEYVKLKGLETQFNTGTAGTVADITSGGLFIMSQGTAAAGANSRDCLFHSRVTFIP